MSADVVNLPQARKKKARGEKEAKAAENRSFFGRTLAERRHAAATKQLQDNELDGARRSGISEAPQTDD